MNHQHHGHHQSDSVIMSTTVAPEHSIHSSHESGSMMHEMMKMYFHFDLGDTILFKQFVAQNGAQLWIACTVFFLIAVLYEGLKCYREYLLQKSYQTCARKYQISTVNAALLESNQTSILCTNGDQNSNNSSTTGNLIGEVAYSTERSEAASHHGHGACGLSNPAIGSHLQHDRRSCPIRRMFSWTHVLQSVLHMLQVATSYTLMLGFMTFQVCICFAILLGVGVGYFIFCWRKLTFVCANEHCH